MLHEALGEAKQILTDEQLERFVEIIRDCGEVRSAASSGGTLMQMMEGSRFAALYMRSVAEN